MNVSIPPSSRIITCVSCALSYCSSSRFRLVDSLCCGGLAMSGSDEVDSAVGGVVVGSLNNPGWGKKTASVFDAFEGVPTCICTSNLLNWSRITDDQSSSFSNHS